MPLSRSRGGNYLAKTLCRCIHISMDEKVGRKLWTEDETILALYLYFQLPFGKIDQRTPEIQELARALGRKDGSVAMKLANFASLDPKITESGRKGLDGASKLDRSVYAQFGSDWTGLVARASELWELRSEPQEAKTDHMRLKEVRSDYRFEPYVGESVASRMVAQRVGQGFFRRAVLANYDEVCCVTGIADSRLLIASHIKPWKDDIENRHNPANGVLLSATIDKAFDCGLLTITNRGRVRIARQLRNSRSPETTAFFSQFEDAEIRAARRFDPDPDFLDWHNRHCFVDVASL
jgi:putative restriction endonuclease